jgi:hypothetical protein
MKAPRLDINDTQHDDILEVAFFPLMLSIVAPLMKVNCNFYLCNY